MWGDVTPAERLRAVTRRRFDDDRLAEDAAGALAGFADDPASLVVACRRVLAHHRTSAPLWWVCAKVLAAGDPVSVASDAARELARDRTADRLSAALPLLDEGEVVAVVGWPAAVDLALVERFDVDAVALRVEGVDPASALRARHSDHVVRVLDPWDARLDRVARLIIPAIAIGPETALVPAGSSDAFAMLREALDECWLLGGVGRVLPARLYDMLVDQRLEDDELEEMSLQRFDRLAGPRGVERTAEAAARVDCPVVPELLRPLD